MSKPKETLEKAYGNIPREVGLSANLAWFPTWRGIRYYWYRLLRKTTR